MPTSYNTAAGEHVLSRGTGWQERLGAVRVAAAEAAQKAATLAARSVMLSDQVRGGLCKAINCLRIVLLVNQPLM